MGIVLLRTQGIATPVFGLVRNDIGICTLGTLIVLDYCAKNVKWRKMWMRMPTMSGSCYFDSLTRISLYAILKIRNRILRGAK